MVVILHQKDSAPALEYFNAELCGNDQYKNHIYKK